MKPRKNEYRVPDLAPRSRCSSCHALIIWISTGKSKMPLSVATLREDEQGVRWALSHFADCPNAVQHRRTTPGGRPPRSGGHTPEGCPGDGDGRAADEAKQGAVGSATMDIRELPDYLRRHGLVVIGSTVRDDGNGRLRVELQTKKVVPQDISSDRMS